MNKNLYFFFASTMTHILLASVMSRKQFTKHGVILSFRPLASGYLLLADPETSSQ
jgi:hypothetical protein